MKSIALLTDFSERAENAADYAMQLAQLLHVNLVLYDSFLVPSGSPLAAQIAWPMEDYDELQTSSENALESFAEKLKKKFHETAGFKPKVSCLCQDGSLALHLGNLSANKNLVLLVMANHDKSIASLLLGDHVRELLDTTTLPLLIIRDHHSFKKISDIAFATDLDITDVEVIRSLVSLAKPGRGQITLIHIGPENGEKEEVKTFMALVSEKIKYPHICYRKMVSAHIMDEIIGLDNNKAYDMLVMVHRHKGFWEELFNQSDTQKMATQISLPLLVYPFPTDSLPVF